MKFGVFRRNSALKESQFLITENLATHQLKAVQVYQLYRRSLLIHTLAMKDGRIRVKVMIFN